MHAPRTTEVVINTRDNNYLREKGVYPFGRVVEGWDVVRGVLGSMGVLSRTV